MSTAAFRAAAHAWFQVAPVVAMRTKDLEYALRSRAERVAKAGGAGLIGPRYHRELRRLTIRHPPRVMAAREVMAGTLAGIRTVTR